MTWRAIAIWPYARVLEESARVQGVAYDPTALFPGGGLNNIRPIFGRCGLEPHRWTSGRGLHSSTFRLNVSTFCGIRWVHDFPPVY